jgi:hypothetical protein
MRTNIEQLIADMTSRFRRDHEQKFPYEGCRKVAALTGAKLADLIPDLDAYFSTIAGYCSWGAEIIDWPAPEVADAESKISQSFFERHAEYSSIKEVISKQNTPDLFDALERCEGMRLALLEILRTIITHR